MIYGLLFVIILIYCYEYWKMISKYQYLFFNNNNIENLDNNAINNKNKDKSQNIINKVKDSFSDSNKNDEFTPYNFTSLSNHAIDITDVSDVKASDPSQDNKIKLELLKLQDKIILFLNKLINNYNELILKALQENENKTIEIQKDIIENIIINNINNEISYINPKNMISLFRNTKVKTYLLINPKTFFNKLNNLNNNSINNAARVEINQFMESIFTDLQKIKFNNELLKKTNKQLENKYFKKKQSFTKYYPNDVYFSKKLLEKNLYLTKPIIREELPCKWKCQRCWFQCHYALDN